MAIPLGWIQAEGLRQLTVAEAGLNADSAIMTTDLMRLNDGTQQGESEPEAPGPPRLTGDDGLGGIVPDLAEFRELIGLQVVQKQIRNHEGIVGPGGKLSHIRGVPPALLRPILGRGLDVQGIQPKPRGESPVAGPNFETAADGQIARKRPAPPAIIAQQTIEPSQVPPAMTSRRGVGGKGVQQLRADRAIHALTII